ncbi:hypothetical protein D0C36_05475 [Mucilaginibacter conchicola]|uniref:Uncharacterized protein n=1 Tax=Mucilaginibacter conchicola TaxID=2303333 RepID=A0A372NZP6_9SPHI|nr:hypothetical protein [Mucilaginibacter conchicola]RFZ94977.1 hypothetical protein D0C36_05475 [Mucilaginibacter conchicola]
MLKNEATGMYYRSKTISLIILAVTAMLCSRALFLFIDDPEGPNLLIVTVLALFMFLISVAVYIFSKLKTNGISRLLAAIGVQLLIVIVLYFCMG